MGRTRYHASWVLPVTSPPIRDGWVDVEDGVILAYGGRSTVGTVPMVRTIDLGHCVILPGLVNAHTHLELSLLRGKVLPRLSMPAWACDVMGTVSSCEASSSNPVAEAVTETRLAGTALVGDISNTLDSLKALDSDTVDAVVFREMLGFNVSDYEVMGLIEPLLRCTRERENSRVQVRAAAHAPYSVSPSLFRALALAVPGPRSVHLAESPEELDFLRDGGGIWREVLKERGRWDSSWCPPGTGPVAYLEALGWLRPDTIAVHGVQLTNDEITQIATAGTTLVTCPRSNHWTGAGEPPIAEFYTLGARVAIGTDSLASAPDLNLFAELAEVRRLAPAVPAARIVESATIVGAAALGRGSSLGAIEVGRPAALIVVSFLGSVSNVEEYIVSGIEPQQITWLKDVDV